MTEIDPQAPLNRKEFNCHCPTCGNHVLKPAREGTGYVCLLRALTLSPLQGVHARGKCPRCHSWVTVPVQLVRPRRLVVRGKPEAEH